MQVRPAIVSFAYDLMTLTRIGRHSGGACGSLCSAAGVHKVLCRSMLR